MINNQLVMIGSVTKVIMIVSTTDYHLRETDPRFPPCSSGGGGGGRGGDGGGDGKSLCTNS